MASSSQRVSGLLGWLASAPAQVPTRVSIPRDRVDIGSTLGGVFQPDEHYFQVRINDMFLSLERRWFVTYIPMVFVVSEYIYSGEEQTVPFMVGPEMIRKHGHEVPRGMVLADTRVAGTHPYRGGRLSLSVVLYRVDYQNYAQNLLRLVQDVAKAIDFTTALSTYLKVADAVLSGVETVLGLENTCPIIGLRKEFDPDAGDMLQPGYFALIDGQVDVNRLWVRNNQLCYGSSLADAAPYDGADYVLYSITQATRRTDTDRLPFYALHKRVRELASQTDANSWALAKANMAAFAGTLLSSPDLVPAQANALIGTYVEEMKQRHEAVQLEVTQPSEEQPRWKRWISEHELEPEKRTEAEEAGKTSDAIPEPEISHIEGSRLEVALRDTASILDM